MYNIVGLVGFAASGKDTVANIMIDSYGYSPIAFADSIKDCLASIFCWDRNMLEGSTPESRIWRERVDPWWAEKLGIPHFTPRWAMTNFGTDLMRAHFNPKIWILNTDRKLSQRRNQRTLIKDCRFANEIGSVRENGGVMYRIKRGPDPAWFSIAAEANTGCPVARAVMMGLDVHESEWAWIGTPIDGTIDNSGTISELPEKVNRAIFSGAC